MKLIVGLGNPGLRYRNTRHNLGSVVIDALLSHFQVPTKRDNASNCLKAKANFKGVNFILCKPLSYMNLSGRAVAKLALRYKLDHQDILVVCDDANLELGRIKIKAKGSPGGHKGLESVVNCLGSKDFPRLRLGIARPEDKGELSDYVLSQFSLAEKRIISEAVERAKEVLLCWLEKGISETMNRFN